MMDILVGKDLWSIGILEILTVDDVMVILDTAFQLVIMCCEMTVDETNAMSINDHPNGRSSFVSPVTSEPCSGVVNFDLSEQREQRSTDEYC